MQREAAAQRFREAFPDLKDARDVTIEELRRRDDLLWNSMLAADAISESTSVAGVPALWVSVPGASSDKCLIWFHGGGYAIGSAPGRRALAAEISRVSRVRVLVPDYRLAPEHPFPAAVDDAVAVTTSAVSSFGADRVLVGGDSAGGGLALAALVALRNRNLTMPAGIAVISPLADWTLSSATHATNRDVDEFVTREMLLRLRSEYLGTEDPAHPLASPALADLSGLPPALVLVGTDETLLDDARTIAHRLRDARGSVELHVFEDMFHIWPMFARSLAEGAAAVQLIADFVRRTGFPLVA